MKKNLLIIILLFSLKSYSQRSVANADPAVDSIKVTNINNTRIDEYRLPQNGTYRIKIPISNKSSRDAIPPGSCKVKLGLGSKLILSPFFNLLTAATSEYFVWTSVLISGQNQIEGELKKPLPTNYLDTLSFDVVGDLLGFSTTVINFFVSNHNSTTILSDENGTNNGSFLDYLVIAPVPGPVPVTFTSLSATKNNCAVSILFGAENEINVKKYDIEISKDGVLFNKTGEIDAEKLIKYSYNFNINTAIASRYLYYRIKSVDYDGRFQYSQTKVIDGLCNEPLSIKVFPNPVTEQRFISIKATNGIFNGNYKVSMYDAAGKLLVTNSYHFLNSPGFDFPITRIASGQYLLKISNESNAAETFTTIIQKK
jgi:hypothetical protein